MKSLTRLAREFSQSFEALSPRTTFIVGLILVLAGGAGDFILGPGMSFTLFYVAGCAAVGWRAGHRPVALLCLAALVLITVHDVTFAPVHPLSAGLVAWKVSTRIAVVGAAAWLAAEVSRLTRNLSHLVEERTAQWKAEVEKHKDVEHTLRTQAWILENMGEAMVMTDNAGIIEVLNPAAARLLGFSAGELTGQPITLLSPFPDSQTPEKFRALQHELEQQTQWLGELPIRRKDGRVLITHVNVTRLQHGQRTVLIALYQDVTERREAEAQLRAREERLQLGLEAGRMITWEADLASDRISYSESVKSFLGGEDLQRYQTLEAYFEQIHPEDRDVAMQTLQSAVAHGKPAEYEYRARHPDGAYHWLLTKGQAIHAGSGNPVRLAGVTLDITERKQAEAALRENEALLRAFFDSPGAFRGIVELLDDDILILSANTAQAAALGRTPESIGGARSSELGVSRPVIDLFIANLKQSREAGRPISFEYSASFRKPATWGLATVACLGMAGNGHHRFGYVTMDITERKKVQELLQQQAQILEQTHDSIVASDRDGRIFFSNKGTERLMGYTAQELFGQHISLLHFDEDLPMLREAVTGTVLAQGQHELEVRARRKSGEAVFVLLSLSQLRDADGQVRGIIGSAVDITERRTAEISLRESEETYRALIETTGTGYLTLDVQGRVLDANAEYVRLTGHTSLQDILGRSVTEWTAPYDVQRNALAVGDCARTGYVRGLEVDYAGPNGHTIPIEINATVVQTRKGQRILALCRDITTRKKAEAALQATNEMLRAIVETAPVAIIGFDLEGRVRDVWNPAAERMLGWRREEVLGLPLPCVPEEGRAHSNELMRRLSQGHSVSDVDVRRRRKDGSPIDYTIYAAPLRDSAGKVTGNISVHVDITHRKRAERQLADALELNLKMVSVSPVGIAAYRKSGQCVFANAALARIVGGSVEEHLAVNFWELPRWRVSGMEGLAAKALDEGRAGTLEVHGRSTFGKECWLLVDFARFVSGGEPHLLALFHDVSERKQAEEALALSRSQLVAAMDLARLANWEYDFTTGHYTFDDRFYGLYGTTAEREGGNQMTPEIYAREFLFPEDAHMVFEGIALAAAASDPDYSVHLEHQIRRRDGQVRHLAVRAAVIKDAAGRTIKIRGVNQDITDRKRAEQQILEISDREQARIGQDLHDGLCQQLVSLAFDANGLQRKLTARGLPEATAAARLADYLDQAITESRRVSRGLFPIRLEAEGLASALEELARSTQTRFKLECRFENRQVVPVSDLTVATHLYRIAQEAVNNSIKHGRPKTISIRLSAHDRTLELRVEDNGVGFSPGAPDGQSGMGLYIMRYRAGSIGATFNIGPGPAGGTAVSCCVPWPPRYSPPN